MAVETKAESFAPAADVDLIVVVFALIVNKDAALNCVVAPDLRHTIAYGVDRTLRVRRIRTAGEAVKIWNADSRDFVWRRLGSGDNVGKVDSQRASVESGQRGIYRYIHAVDTYRAAQLVDKGWRDCPSPCENVRLVGTIEILAGEA